MESFKKATVTAKEKIGNLAADTEETLEKFKASATEKVEKMKARDKVERKVAQDRKEAKEELAEVKVQHKKTENRLRAVSKKEARSCR